MPAYCRAAQFPVWGRLLSERPRRRWEWRLLAFVASAAIRPPRANGCRSKSGERERRARRRRQGLWYGAGRRGESEIHPDSVVARLVLRSFLVRGWSSHFPCSMSFVFLWLTLELVQARPRTVLGQPKDHVVGVTS